ncbi:beta-amylase 8-like [Quillaja saponaria]|uniref:Protein BZR1 homolog n=1 Tax=Quillaja saponaria TaxID=32244 RepID=A0AAD7L383_QUISA|nr:beta-amylase 8-like [Quillaja saponaria]
MVDKGKKNAMKGCIKATKGCWIVHRTTKHGGIFTKYRFPSERERQNNKCRERNRRAITKKIFAGLKEHGNYQLRKTADKTDLLKCLCNEAGWNVDDDGTIRGKKISSKFKFDLNDRPSEDDYCLCDKW